MKQKQEEIARLEVTVGKYGDIGTDTDREKIQTLKGEIENTPATIQKLYASLDTDSNGYLDQMEFLDGLIKLTVGLNREELELIFSLFDRNNDNKVDLAEFAAIFDGDDIKRANDPNRRKVSQLALRRPSMIQALHNHTKTTRMHNFKKKTKQVHRRQGKPTPKVSFNSGSKIKMPNAPKVKKFRAGKLKSGVWQTQSQSARCTTKREKQPASDFMSARSGRVFQRRVNHLKQKLPAEQGLIVWSGQVWQKTPTMPNSKGNKGQYRCMQNRGEGLSPITLGWTELSPVTNDLDC